ncbi:MAG: hypothetical protein ICV64_04465 [Thermoleophilia bacterium]|nr:hypothetical protein [Thermoleophilia bacterium]
MTMELDGFPIRIRRDEVDGVRVFWSEAPPPFSATLAFGVGRADETLVSGGVTHLVEHLAMPAHARHPFELNARVDALRTLFWAHGEREEVAGFLSGVASALSDLPLERLEAERRILRAESAGERFSAYTALLATRFGAGGMGLLDYEEYGLWKLGPEDVAAWARGRFTAESAVLWLTGPPDGLELELPRGEPARPFVPRPVGHTLPGFVASPPGGVALSALLPRTAAVRAMSEILRDRLHHSLRYGSGISYGSLLEYDRLNADEVHVYVGGDVLAGHEEEARDRTLETVTALAADGGSDEEVERVREAARRAAVDASEPRAWLDTVAEQVLLGSRPQSPAELLPEVEEVDALAVAHAAGNLAETAIVGLPAELELPRDRFHALSQWVDEPLPGRRFLPRRRGALRRRPPLSLVVGPDGVSLDDGSGVGTIRVADAAGLVRWRPPLRTIHRRDGRSLTIEDGAFWRRGDEAVAAVDAAFPPELVVDVDRDPRG